MWDSGICPSGLTSPTVPWSSSAPCGPWASDNSNTSQGRCSMRRSAGLLLFACMAASVPAVAQTAEELRRQVDALRQRYDAQQHALMLLVQRLRQLEGAASAPQPARPP